MLKRRSLPSLRLSKTLASLSSSSTSSPCKKRSLPLLPSSPRPPAVPKKTPFAVSAHGATWDDPFHWMSDTGDPVLIDYLSRENSYAEAFLADTRDLQMKLAAEMRSRIPASVSTPPERWGKWLYYQHIPEGREYPVLCRKLCYVDSFKGKLLNYLAGSAKEEILLDWNEIAEQYGYVHIGTCRISPDHNFLAYTLDIRGSELFMLRLKDLRTGQIISGSRLEGVVSLAWARDSSCILYTLCDGNQRPDRKLGGNGEDDLFFVENDLSCCVDITSTKDGKFITINSNSRSSSEVYVLDATNLKEGLWLVRKRVLGVQYFLEHHYGFFYILTNAPLDSMTFAAEGYRVVRCRAKKSLLANWQDVILPGSDSTFEDMDMFDGHLVLSLQKKGLSMLCSIDMPINVDNELPKTIEDLNPWFFPLPSSLCSFLPGSNQDFNSSIYRVIVSSPVMPDLVLDYDMTKQKFTFLVQEEVVGLPTGKETSSHVYRGWHNASCTELTDDLFWKKVEASQKWDNLFEAHSCERKEVISHDGVMVPLTILYSCKAQFTGNAPGLIYGYGAYGEVLDKSWCADLICLLDRGWVVAYADVRGGGDTTWHQAGTRKHKLNSFHDFAACAMFLINEGYVHKEKLAAIGCSAGGLLVGATMNMYPNIFSAAILKVPFLDICNTMLDPNLPLTMLDYDEFGDPRNQAEFETIHCYSPYDNIRLGVCYPSTLVTASFHDSRVGVWEAAKWVAKVRENTCSNCSRAVILKTSMSGGHFSESGRFKHCEDTAFEYAFLMKAMGLHNEEIQ